MEAREIFVSYSQSDRDCAFEVTDHLEANGFNVWIAPRDVSPSADWAEEIIDAISGARVMVLIFSDSSNGSPQVRREVERAVHKQLRILPFRIEQVLPSRSLEYFLSTQHWLDAFPPPRDAHYAKLCVYLRSILGAPERAPGGANMPEARVPQAPVREASSAAQPAREPCLPAGELRQLELHLARLVGPIAHVLVGRAARVANGVDDLLARLAAELQSRDDQRRFLDACEWLRRLS